MFRTALRRASPSSLSSTAQRPFQPRRYSSQQQPSATSAFYKTFTRPVAKCALLAVLTYQLVYYGWTKLEHDEIKAERQDEITKLEAQVKRLQIAREAEAAAAATAATATADANENAKGEEGGRGKVSSWKWWPW